MDYTPARLKIEVSDGGKAIRLTGDFDEIGRHQGALRQHQNAEVLSFACNHWSSLSLVFLFSFARLRVLRIETSYDHILVPELTAMRSLEELFLSQACHIDLSGLKGLPLKRLHFRGSRENVKNLSSVGELRELEFLAIAQMRADDLMDFSSLIKLRVLELTGSKIDSTRGLEMLRELREAKIASRLKHLVGRLSELVHLRVLNLDWNPDIDDLSALSGLHLSEFSIWDAKRLKSLKPLETIKTLRRLCLAGKIMDDDLRPILRLPLLEYCALRGRKYFGDKLERLGEPVDGKWQLV